MHELYRLGGELSHVATPFVASGEHMSPPNRIASDKIIRNGDMVFIDIGAMWSATSATSPHRRLRQSPNSASRRSIPQFTKRWHRHATMRAGATNETWPAPQGGCAEWGFADNFICLFIGHGIGIGSNEPPYIGEALPGAETVTLRAGMTFAVEPLIWIPGVRGGGGVRLEDTIQVTAKGGRSLDRAPWDKELLLS